MKRLIQYILIFCSTSSIILLMAAGGLAAASNPDIYTNLYLPIITHNVSTHLVNKIAFASGYTDSNPRFDIYVMNPDGSNVFQVTTGMTSSNLNPVLSPDGSQIAFTANSGTDTQEIYTIKVGGSGLHKLVSVTGHHSHPSWSPDGLKIAFSSDLQSPGPDTPNDIYVINADGSGEPANITNTPNSHDYEPDWSPDGKKIAFTASLAPNYDSSDLYTINLDGSGLVNLTDSQVNDNAPDWSPDGSKIVFFSNLGAEDRQIMVIDVASKVTTQITSNPGQNWYPNWSPDGSQIVFQTYFTSYADIYKMNADGSGTTNLTNHQDDYASIQPDWR